MTPAGRPLDAETLLAHAGWVRALARSLVADGQGADDVVQLTLIAALERPPRDDVPLRPWLARVARNFSLQAIRARSRRARHEARARLPEPEPSPDESVARAEAHRAVVDAVLALEPIHRDVLVARFLDELPMSDVARRLGIAEETAWTRLRRGLAKVRERLDRREGGRRRWALLLLGPRGAEGPRPRVGSAAPTTTVPTTTVAAAGAVGGAIVLKKLLAVTALILLVAFVAHEAFAPPASPSRDTAAAGTDGDPPRAPFEREPPARAALPQDDAPVAAVAPTPAPVRRAFATDVCDALTLQPIRGATAIVATDAGDIPATADESGRLRIDAPDGAERASVVVVAPGYTAVTTELSAGAEPVTTALWPARLARSTQWLTGTVVGADGAAVAGVAVLARAGAAWTGSAVTDTAGRFRFDPPWNVFYAVITATHAKLGDGFAEARHAYESPRTWSRFSDVRVVLGSPSPLRVRIRRGDGAPAATERHRLVASPQRAWSAGRTPQRFDVADGELVVLPIGVSLLELFAAGDGPRVAEPCVVAVDAEGVRVCGSPFRHQDGPMTDVPGGPRVEEVVFDSASRVFRVVVTDAADGAALPGVRVVLEDAREAEAAGPSFSERPDEEALQPSGITMDIRDPRRAPRHLRVEAVTDARGVAELRGWLPSEGVLSAEGPHLVREHRRAAATEIASGSTSFIVTTGGTVSVAFPRSLTACVVERVDVPAPLARLTPDRAEMALAAGSYRVRTVRVPGHSADEAVLVPPFELRRGDTRHVDLTDVAPRITDVLVMRRLAAVQGACVRPTWEHDADPTLRLLREGEASFVRSWTYGVRRFDLMWTVDGIEHVHAVDARGGEHAAQPTVLRHDLDYDAATLDIGVEGDGLEPGSWISVSARWPDAPLADAHSVRVPASAVVRGEVRVRDLPAGDYWVGVDGPTRRSTPQMQVTLRRAATERVRLPVDDFTLVVEVAGAAAPTEVGANGERLTLVPEGAESARRHILCDRWDAPLASFWRVPPGRYRLLLRKMGKPRREGTVWYSSLVTVAERDVVVEPGVHRVAVRIDGPDTPVPDAR